MNTFVTNIIAFALRYKLYFFLSIPLVLILFSVILISFFQSPVSQTPRTSVIPTVVSHTNSPPIPTTKPTGLNRTIEPVESVEGEGIEDRSGLLKKEQLSDGTTQYTYTSPNPERPNIIIARDEQDILFERAVSLPDYPVKISEYTQPYGQPERIIRGSLFYGSSAETYIYAQRGFAFIANPETTLVLEQHLFSPVSVNEYIKKYGDDIPSNTR